MSVQIVALTGSLRAASWNTTLMHVAAKAAERAGASVTIANLRDYEMPLYNQEIEDADGIPDAAKRLRSIMREAQGMIIASPEYNSSITAPLKNAIDWVSRPDGDVPPLAAFDGKVAGLIAASPGGLGGLRGLFALRSILSNIRVHVIPAQYALSSAHEAFDENGQLTDETARTQIDRISKEVVRVAGALHD